jgi:peroxiredoxin
MKTLIIMMGVCLLFSATVAIGQQTIIPSVKLLTTDLSTVNSNTLLDSNEVVILIFWKTSNKKCCCHISSMIEAKEQMLQGKNVKIIGICSGEGGNVCHIKPFVAGRDWDMEVYIDTNDDLKRAMGIPDTPYTIVIDKDNKVICQYNGYCIGSETLICEKLQSYLVMN